MAIFRDEAEEFQQLDWELLRDGAINLYFRPEFLAKMWNGSELIITDLTALTVQLGLASLLGGCSPGHNPEPALLPAWPRRRRMLELFALPTPNKTRNQKELRA